MGGRSGKTDPGFEWVYTQQPHVARRVIILKKYPEIKKLMGPDKDLKYIVSAMVIFQIVSSYYIGQLSWWWILLLAYCLGGVINHSLTLAIHENAHNVVFGNYYPMANKLFGMWINLPIGFPMSVSFKHYHMEHHRYLGMDIYDSNLSTDLEARFFRNTPLKMLWMFLQPLFFVLRPLFVDRPKPSLMLTSLNTAIQLIFDSLILYFFGLKSLLYLIVGSLLSMGLHPMAAHYIAEHYVFDRGYETYSYYGIWNKITFNAGYHMEHHDFPYIPGSRLPEVTRIAAEFYEPLPKHDSWLKVIWDFLFKDHIGPFSRIKRRYDDIHGCKREQNSSLLMDTPATWPMRPKGQIQKLIELQCKNPFIQPSSDSTAFDDDSVGVSDSGYSEASSEGKDN